LPAIVGDDVVEVFEKYGVLSQRELASREEVYSEIYCAKVNVEANLVTEMGRTMIYPAAVTYLNDLATTAANMKSISKDFNTATLDKVSGLIGDLESALDALDTIHAADTHEPSYQANEVLPAMLKVREAADALEALVPDSLWPLPTYQEMLFIK
jgi:glutamine synthetase